MFKSQNRLKPSHLRSACGRPVRGTIHALLHTVPLLHTLPLLHTSFCVRSLQRRSSYLSRLCVRVVVWRCGPPGTTTDLYADVTVHVPTHLTDRLAAEKALVERLEREREEQRVCIGCESQRRLPSTPSTASRLSPAASSSLHTPV